MTTPLTRTTDAVSANGGIAIKQQSRKGNLNQFTAVHGARPV